MPAISNTRPLILLTKINRLELLHHLFEDVFVPPIVLHEIHGHGVDDETVRAVLAARWIEVHEVSDADSQRHLLGGLDAGEAGVIGLAVQFGRTLPVLLDDLAARRQASGMGLRVAGTGGILVGAKDEGLIPTVRPELDRLRDAGLRISGPAYAQILKLAGESTA